MCLAVPLKIAEIDGEEAIVERDGVHRRVNIRFIKEPKIGDYVLVHAGFAIQKIKAKQAMEDIEALHELEEALRA